MLADHQLLCNTMCALQATDKARRTVAGEAGSAQVGLVLLAKLLSLCCRASFTT